MFKLKKKIHRKAFFTLYLKIFSQIHLMPSNFSKDVKYYNFFIGFKYFCFLDEEGPEGVAVVSIREGAARGQM